MLNNFSISTTKSYVKINKKINCSAVNWDHKIPLISLNLGKRQCLLCFFNMKWNINYWWQNIRFIVLIYSLSIDKSTEKVSMGFLNFSALNVSPHVTEHILFQFKHPYVAEYYRNKYTCPIYWVVEYSLKSRHILKTIHNSHVITDKIIITQVISNPMRR